MSALDDLVDAGTPTKVGHCHHCGGNCADDHRAPHTWPQTWHYDEDRIVGWATGCCPFCRLETP